MHIIRLRRPWTRISVGSAGAEQTNAKADVPDSDAAMLSEQFTYRRSFNRPTGLSDLSRVFLAISDWQGRLQTLQFNQECIELAEPTSAPLRVDVTSHLELSNKIEIVISKTNDQSPLLCGEVQIEIEGE